MACPFFRPTSVLEPGVRGESLRPPLGELYRGGCAASDDESFEPPEDQLRDCCNMGYAEGRCRRLPPERDADALRFTIASADEAQLEIRWSTERNHLPVSAGVLQWNRRGAQWRQPPLRSDVGALAAAYRNAYLRALDFANSAEPTEPAQSARE